MWVNDEWRLGQTAILTQVLLLTLAAHLPHLGLGFSTGGLWGTQPSVCKLVLILAFLSPTSPPTVDTLSKLFPNVLLLPLFFGLFTQVHLLIDGLVEGQYITIIPSLFFKIPSVDIFLTSLSIPLTHILQNNAQGQQQKNTKINYLNNSKITKSLHIGDFLNIGKLTSFKLFPYSFWVCLANYMHTSKYITDSSFIIPKNP